MPFLLIMGLLLLDLLTLALIRFVEGERGREREREGERERGEREREGERERRKQLKKSYNLCN
jgi:hypothetical protein